MKSRTKILWGILALAIVVGAGVGVVTVWHHSSTTQTAVKVSHKKNPYKKAVNLVALGDSLTQGVGDQDDNGGYVGIIKQTISSQYHTKVNASNYGVAGDRSDQITSRLDSDAAFQAKVKSADVIVMTVGGNDLMQILEKVALVNSASSVTSTVAAGSKTYDTKLRVLLTDVRKYNSHAPIFLYSIYNPFYVYFANVASLNNSVAAWNDTTKQTLKGYGPAYFVDINDLMSHGQYTTKSQQDKLAQDDEKLNSQSSLSQTTTSKIMASGKSNLNKYISTDDNFHPNHLGYEKMSIKLLKQMSIHDAWIKK